VARSFDGSSRTLGHVLCAEAFNDNGAVLPTDGGSGPVRPIFADAGLPGAEMGNDGLSDSLALTASLAAGSDTTRGVDLLGKRADAGGQLVASAVGQHQWHSNASIYTDYAGWMDDVSVKLASDADLPSEIRHGNGSLHNAAIYRTVAPELDPADLGKLDRAFVAIEALYFDLSASEREVVVGALAVRSGKASTASKKVLERSVERPDRHLLSGLADGADKIALGAKRSQLASLRHVVEVVASAFLVSLPPITTLIQAYVVDQSADAGMLAKQDGLRLCRFQLECDTPINHIKLNCTQRVESQGQ
jgi:hypothetical protein